MATFTFQSTHQILERVASDETNLLTLADFWEGQRGDDLRDRMISAMVLGGVPLRDARAQADLVIEEMHQLETTLRQAVRLCLNITGYVTAIDREVAGAANDTPKMKVD